MAGSAQGNPAPYGKALALLASLFFMWGFISVINNTLLPHLRSVFELNYLETTLIESTWFIGYLLASLPSAMLIRRIGYQRALTTGLTVMTIGSLGMILAGTIGNMYDRVFTEVHEVRDFIKFYYRPAAGGEKVWPLFNLCLLYTSPSPRD